jgi:hypothetical protein
MKTLATILFIAATLPASAAPTRRPTLQEQAMCAAQAKKYYPVPGPGEFSMGPLRDYESHYNVKEQRCLVLETKMDWSKDGGYVGRIRLFDAFEKHVLAEMSVSCGLLHDDDLKRFSPFDCEYRRDRSKLKFYCVLDGGLCYSGTDFSKYVSRHMNDEDDEQK